MVDFAEIAFWTGVGFAVLVLLFALVLAIFLLFGAKALGGIDKPGYMRSVIIVLFAEILYIIFGIGLVTLVIGAEVGQSAEQSIAFVIQAALQMVTDPAALLGQLLDEANKFVAASYSNTKAGDKVLGDMLADLKSYLVWLSSNFAWVVIVLVVAEFLGLYIAAYILWFFKANAGQVLRAIAPLAVIYGFFAAVKFTPVFFMLNMLIFDIGLIEQVLEYLPSGG